MIESCQYLRLEDLTPDHTKPCYQEHSEYQNECIYKIQEKNSLRKFIKKIQEERLKWKAHQENSRRKTQEENSPRKFLISTTLDPCSIYSMSASNR